MTLAQYKDITSHITNFNDEVAYIFTAENTKIMTDRYPKIEIDETTEMVRAYVLHPSSKPDKPIYSLSFACTLDSVFAIQFKVKAGVESTDKNGNKIFTPTLQKQVDDAYLIGNYN